MEHQSAVSNVVTRSLHHPPLPSVWSDPLWELPEQHRQLLSARRSCSDRVGACHFQPDRFLRGCSDTALSILRDDITSGATQPKSDACPQVTCRHTRLPTCSTRPRAALESSGLRCSRNKPEQPVQLSEDSSETNRQRSQTVQHPLGLQGSGMRWTVPVTGSGQGAQKTASGPSHLNNLFPQHCTLHTAHPRHPRHSTSHTCNTAHPTHSAHQRRCTPHTLCTPATLHPRDTARRTAPRACGTLSAGSACSCWRATRGG